jgi:hypothetical protein
MSDPLSPGTATHPGNAVGSGRAARGDPPARPDPATAAVETATPAADPRTAANAAAEREWRRLADLPTADRVALVADTVWGHAYPPAYRAAYIDAASQIGDRATQAANNNPGARQPLLLLYVAVVDAISQLNPGQPFTPPADHNTVAVTRAAADTPGRQPAWQRVADAAWVRGQTAGILHGTLTAATDVMTGWRAHGGDELAETVSIDGRPGRHWVATLLSTVNQAAAAPRSRNTGIGAARTAAQLAREDQAPGVPAIPAALPAGRPRRALPAGPEATTSTRRTR